MSLNTGLWTAGCFESGSWFPTGFRYFNPPQWLVFNIKMFMLLYLQQFFFSINNGLISSNWKTGWAILKTWPNIWGPYTHIQGPFSLYSFLFHGCCIVSMHREEKRESVVKRLVKNFNHLNQVIKKIKQIHIIIYFFLYVIDSIMKWKVFFMNSGSSSSVN